MNLERKKMWLNQLLPILSETQEQTFEKDLPVIFKLKSISILVVRNQTDLLIASVR